MNNSDCPGGTTYEVDGFQALHRDAKQEFEASLVNFFLPHAACAHSLIRDGKIWLYADRHGEYPDLMLEMTADGRLLVQDMDVRRCGLLARLEKFLHTFPRSEPIPALSLHIVRFQQQ